MIRPAVHSDIEALLPMAQQFHAISGYAMVIPYAPEALRALAGRMIDSEAAVILVLECDGQLCGMIGGAIAPSYLNPDITMATELFWWIDPAHRASTGAVRLLHAFEQWAIASGAATLSMMTIEQMNADSVGSIYERMGYRLAERTYVKEL